MKDMKQLAILVAALITAAGNASAQVKGSIECQILRNQVVQAYLNSAPALSQEELAHQRAQQYAQLTPEQRVAQGTYESAYGVGQGLAKAMGVDITDSRSKEALLQKYKTNCE